MTGEPVTDDLETLRYKVLFRTAGTDRVRALGNLLDACAAASRAHSSKEAAAWITENGGDTL